MDLPLLPTINAGLNAVAMILLICGRALIRAGRVAAHRKVMLSAFSVSALFLVLYVIHKASRGFENQTFQATGALKSFYLAILFSHLTLAMLVPVLAIALLRFGLTEQIARHRRLARIAWPIWIYVSASGIAIYLMLYLRDPSGG